MCPCDRYGYFLRIFGVKLVRHKNILFGQKMYRFLLVVSNGSDSRYVTYMLVDICTVVLFKCYKETSIFSCNRNYV